MLLPAEGVTVCECVREYLSVRRFLSGGGGWSVLEEELLVEGCKHQRLHVKGERSGASM